jgi:hypothetical protein
VNAIEISPALKIREPSNNSTIHGRGNGFLDFAKSGKRLSARCEVSENIAAAGANPIPEESD